MTTLVNATTTTITKYYFFNGQRVAMRQNGTLTYLHGDHLGSASLATTAIGAQLSTQRYLPYGGTRNGSMPTDRAPRRRGGIYRPAPRDLPGLLRL